MKDFSELQAKIQRLAQQSPYFVDNVLPHAVATVAANHFKENFQTESFEGNKWPEVNRRKPDYTARDGKLKKTYKIKSDKGQWDSMKSKILTGPTGDLGKSIEPDPAKSNGGNAVVTMREYGQYHDEGGPNLPRRQITGQTPQLNQIISSELDKQFQKFFSQP